MIDRTLRENLRVINGLEPRPRRALEVGALPDERGVLANCPAIADRRAINLRERGEFAGVSVERGDARSLPWPDESFDLVVAASTLEHIPDFWLACREMTRVLAPGGHLLVSTPGFDRLRGERALHGLAARLPLPDLLRRGSITMRMHDHRDYYRFSPHAYEEVVLGGLEDVHIWRIMTPPRLFGIGTKPHG